MTTMRALVFDGTRATVEPRRPAPDLPPGEVLIRPTRMGVCATDLAICRGYMGFTGVLGHEFVGVVEAASDRADRGWVGRRVVGNINCPRDPEADDMVQAGVPDHARDRSVLGIQGRDGCFADRFTLPAANLFAVPEPVDDDHAVFAEPLAAALQVCRQLDVAAFPFVTVLGDGRLGLLVAQVLHAVNPSVRVVGRHDTKLRLCEKWGIKHRPLDDVKLQQDQDLVVDCTGSPTGLATAMRMVRPRGTIVMKTTTTPGDEPLDLSPIVVHEVTVLGSRCGPFADALDALSGGRVDVVSLITRRMKLADGVDALRVAGQRGSLKVLLEP